MKDFVPKTLQEVENLLLTEYSSSNPSEEKIKQLLEKKPNVNVQDQYGATPLHWACKQGRKKELAQMLLDVDANPNMPDNNGLLPLYWAVGEGNNDVFKILIPKTDLNIKSREGDTILRFAVITGNCVAIEHLCSNENINVDVKERSTQKFSLLHEAILSNQLEVVKLLLEKGLDVNALGGQHEETALILAIRTGKKDIFEILLEQENTDIFKADSSGLTPLHWAASKNHIEMIDSLWRKNNNIDINACDHNGNTPLHWAAFKNHSTVFDRLIELGADINLKDKLGRTPSNFVISKAQNIDSNALASASPTDEFKSTAPTVDEFKPTALTVDEFKPTAPTVDEFKPTALTVGSRIASFLIALGYALIAGPFLGRTKIDPKNTDYAWEAPIGLLVNTYNNTYNRMPGVFPKPLSALIAIATTTAVTTLASPFLVALIPVNMVLALVEQARNNSFEKTIKGLIKRARSKKEEIQTKTPLAADSKSPTTVTNHSADPSKGSGRSPALLHRKNSEKRGSKEREKEEEIVVEEEKKQKRNFEPQ